MAMIALATDLEGILLSLQMLHDAARDRHEHHASIARLLSVVVRREGVLSFLLEEEVELVLHRLGHAVCEFARLQVRRRRRRGAEPARPDIRSHQVTPPAPWSTTGSALVA